MPRIGNVSAAFMLAVGMFVGVFRAHAQITNVTNDQATPVPGVPHDYIKLLAETVNPATGSLSIRIQIPMSRARQLNMPFSIDYDSNGIGALGLIAQGSARPSVAASGLEVGGWRYGVPMLSYTRTFLQKVINQLPPVRYATCYYDTNYVFQDAGGGRHALYVAYIYPDQVSGHYNQTICNTDFSITPVSSGGDTFYQAEFDTSTSRWHIADADGTVYTFNQDTTPPPINNDGSGTNTPCNDGAGSTTSCTELALGSIEDRNGNVAGLGLTSPLTNPVYESPITFVDDLGRGFTAPGLALNGSLAILGVSGSYTITWGTVGGTGSSPSGPVTDRSGGDPNCSFNSSYPFSTVIKSITLPNGKSYTFGYDTTFGLVNKITYPTGGTVSYVWSWRADAEAAYFADSLNQPYCKYTYGVPAITQRTVSYDGVTTTLQQTLTYPPITWTIGSTAPTWTTKQTTVATTDNISGINSSTTYTYTAIAPALQPYEFARYSGITSFAAQIPIEQSNQYKNGSGSTLRIVTKGWGGLGGSLLACEEEQIGSSGPISGTFYGYDSLQFGLVAVLADKKEYDYGLLSSGSCYTGAAYPSVTPTRETVTTFQSFSPTPIYPGTASILDRPCKTIVQGNGSTAAETDYFYDNGATTTTCGSAGTPSTTGAGGSSIVGHDEANYSTSSTTPRGNLTQKTQWLNTGASPVTTYTYDETGQVLSRTDPCGNGTCSDVSGNQTTLYSYADSFLNSGGYTTTAGSPPSGMVTNAFLTKITLPTTYTERYSYGYNDGELTQAIDQNSQPTTYKYNDPLGRLTETDYPDTGETTVSYNDATPSVTTATLISSGVNLSSTATMDGLGHVIENQLTTDPDGPTATATVYDGYGRVHQAYNPTRCSTPKTNCGTETTWGYATYVYDALGRATSITEADGSSVQTTYDQSCTVGSNTQVGTTVTDEVGNQRQTCSDGLGRLTGAYEAPNVTGYNFQTIYQYDALNDLVAVTQNGNNSSNARVRSFQYDSLGRLTSATNPESGTITYTYDLNSNLATRVSPKAGQTGTNKTTITYSYDALNRVTKEISANPANVNDFYAYDGNTISSGLCGQNPPVITLPTNLLGRRSAMCSGESGASWSYDPMGRPLLETSVNASTGNQPKYSVGYTYNLDGSISTITYPSGDVVTYTWAGAPGGAGRPMGVSDSSTTYVASGSSNHATYSPNGALATMVNGFTTGFAGIITSNFYNDRLQPALLSASLGGPPIFALCYDFHVGQSLSISHNCQLSASSSGDNGNVFQILNNADPTRSTQFIYDPLNRIAQAVTVNTTSTNCWGQTFSATATAPGVLPTTSGIDPWSNLFAISSVAGIGGGCTTSNLSATPTTQNQLSGIGMTYDAAGNVTNDGHGNLPTYDAENRISSVAGVNYYYDADGMRTEKSSGTKYWYGPGGEVLTETSLSGTISEEYIYFNGQRIARVDRPSGTVHYYFSNLLGSHTMVTNATGTCEQDIDYFPYGGVITDHCPVVAQHYKFTAKERDAESGLDNFGARYNASSLGRFMTPDLMGGHYEDPQTLNRYAYVRNNPLRFTDPTGLDFYLTCSGKDTATCQGGHVGTTDDKGKFTATVVTSASLQDPKSGNTATVNGSGVQITTANGTYGGEFINNTPAANGIQGSGALAGFSFDVNGNCGGSCLASGAFHFSGSGDQARALLATRGAWSYWAMDTLDSTDFGFHPETDQFRFGSGPSSHLSVPWNDVMRPDYSRHMSGINALEGDSGFVLRSVHNPRSAVPINGDFHVDKATGAGHAKDAFCSVAGCN